MLQRSAVPSLTCSQLLFPPTSNLVEAGHRIRAGSEAATMHSEDSVKLFIGSLHSRDLNMAASIAKVAASTQTVREHLCRPIPSHVHLMPYGWPRLLAA